MAIPSTKLSELLGELISPDEKLLRLRELALLSPSARDEDVLSVIREVEHAHQEQLARFGFMWVTPCTVIAGRLNTSGYLSERGLNWNTWVPPDEVGVEGSPEPMASPSDGPPVPPKRPSVLSPPPRPKPRASE